MSASLERNDGRMWESNPPSPFVRSRAGFEVQRGHQTPCPPGGQILFDSGPIFKRSNNFKASVPLGKTRQKAERERRISRNLGSPSGPDKDAESKSGPGNRTGPG